MRKSYALGMLVCLALLAFGAFPSAAAAAGPSDIVITTPYPWIVADKGKTVTFNVDVTNSGQSYQTLGLQVADAPANWKPVFKDSNEEVRQVIVAPGKTQSLTFQADPPADAKAADYAFLLKAVGPDGAMLSDLPLKVSLGNTVSKGLSMTTQYPDLRGQAGTTFSFSLNLQNDATNDRSVSLSANAPQGWEVAFQPASDTKQVSAILMKAGDSQGVDVNVTAPQQVEAGDYTIAVEASAGTDHVQVPLKVTVLGNYKISLDTNSGQLNTTATVDQPSSVTFVVKNAGASTLQKVSVSATPPNGWQVTFNPSTIDSIPPEQSRQVTASIKPGGTALAGDYMVSVTASADQTTDSKDLRVTVNTPTTWGWAGVLVIVIVLGGLGFMFARLSRR